ncbi:helix-turn-helix transcriptional regulator [Williamsia herbipolensis]|uniref:Helix-turn-helix transcriptional regulator n=1 Tax=Williamsia herbipolensis TaxID=1603258 RepID=A0AAU4JXG1_9NOCA|nr:helix-turn-helix domain-containing protein [Williamsia herbipolensis]
MAMNLDGVLADRSRWTAEECSVAKALEVVGSRTAMLFLREAFYGTTRFADFAQRVGVTDAAAATRLKQLVSDGIFAKRPYQEPGSRPRHEYVLTDKGRDLLPVVLAMMEWGDRHLQPQGPPVEVVDAAGERVGVSVRTSAGDEVNLDALRLRRGRRT